MAALSTQFRQLGPDDPDIPAALDVMRGAFAGMQERIDPPSSLNEMTVATLRETARACEIWVCGDPVIGTIILTPKSQVLHVSKLAVRDRRAGLGRALLEFATTRAATLGLGWLELKSRVELVEVHTVFKRLGFYEVARLSHAGFARPTYVVFRKVVVEHG